MHQSCSLISPFARRAGLEDAVTGMQSRAKKFLAEQNIALHFAARAQPEGFLEDEAGDDDLGATDGGATEGCDGRCGAEAVVVGADGRGKALEGAAGL